MAAKNFKSCKTFPLSSLISYQKSLLSKWIYSLTFICGITLFMQMMHVR